MKVEKNGKVFETQEEMTGYITGKVKGGLLQPLMACLVLCRPHNRCKTSQKNRSPNEHTSKSNCYKN